MTRDEALARADRLAPPAADGGVGRVLFAPDRGTAPHLLEREFLQSSDALGVLAAEVRKLDTELAEWQQNDEAVQAQLTRVCGERDRLEQATREFLKLSAQARRRAEAAEARVATLEAAARELMRLVDAGSWEDAGMHVTSAELAEASAALERALSVDAAERTEEPPP